MGLRPTEEVVVAHQKLSRPRLNLRPQQKGIAALVNQFYEEGAHTWGFIWQKEGGRRSWCALQKRQQIGKSHSSNSLIWTVGCRELLRLPKIQHCGERFKIGCEEERGEAAT